MEPELEDMTIDAAKTTLLVKTKWPVWLYAFFFVPSYLTFSIMYLAVQLDALFSGIVALAVMNGSINSVIAYITIKARR